MNWYNKKLFKQALEYSEVDGLKTDRSGVLPLMFGENVRFSVPLSVSILDDISAKLTEKGYRVDLDKRIAYKRSLNRDGKEQWQPISLGKVIGRELGKETLDNYSKPNNKPSELDNSEYSVVFSKSAVDVARMSDHLGIESCHSPGGSYFQCAISEGKNGGAIAYVVKTDDLAGVSLNDEEIFKDEDREIDGIKPLARLRLRRIVNEETGEEIAIPETRTYGKKVSGFMETVFSIAREKQLELLEKYKNTPREQDFKIHGGTYQDTSSSELVNKFFGDKGDHRDLESVDEDGRSNVELWEEEVEAIREQYDDQLRYFSIYNEVMDEGQVHLYTSVNMSIPFAEFLGINIDNKFGDWQESREFERIIRDVLNKVFDGYVGEIDIEDDEMRIKFETDVGHPDELADLYIDCIREEKKIPEYMKAIRSGLLAIGSPHIEPIENTVDLSKFAFKNILVTEDEEYHDFIDFYINYPIKLGTFGWHYPQRSSQIIPNVSPSIDVMHHINANIERQIVGLIESWVRPLTKTQVIKQETSSGQKTHRTNKITKSTVDFKQDSSSAFADIKIHKNIDEHTANYVYETLLGLDNNYQNCLSSLQQIYNNDLTAASDKNKDSSAPISPITAIPAIPAIPATPPPSIAPTAVAPNPQKQATSKRSINWYKLSAKPKDSPLVGKLQSNDGYIYLKIDDNIFSSFLNMIPFDKVISPKEVTEKSKDVGAHISVMKKKETEDLVIEEIGNNFEFFVDGFQCVEPDGWDEVKKVYFLTVLSPDLENLRKKYKLNKKIDGHNFHITVGVEKR